MVIPLEHMDIGRTADIVWIASDDTMAKKLTCLGFVPGGKVEYIFCGHKDGMRAFRVSGSIVALRDSTTREILVKPL